jgi:hypothetical protein
MIQCKDCEFCQIGPDNHKTFTCDPFSTIKEPECLAKWQLIRLDMLVASHQGLVRWYGRLAPLQDKIFKFMKRELDDMEQTDSWKLDTETDPDLLDKGDPDDTEKL